MRGVPKDGYPKTKYECAQCLEYNSNWKNKYSCPECLERWTRAIDTAIKRYKKSAH